MFGEIDGYRVKRKVHDAHTECHRLDEQPHWNQGSNETDNAENDQEAHCSMRNTPLIEALHVSVHHVSQRDGDPYLRMLSKKFAKSDS